MTEKFLTNVEDQMVHTLDLVITPALLLMKMVKLNLLEKM